MMNGVEEQVVWVDIEHCRINFVDKHGSNQGHDHDREEPNRVGSVVEQCLKKQNNAAYLCTYIICTCK
jgi:hypothetical protein